MNVDESTASSASAEPSWAERSVLNTRRGVPWWGAVLIALGAAVVGAFIDQLATDSLSVVFQMCYAVGALAAVLAVQRRNLFGPMVQPPLIMAVTVPVVVLTAAGLPEGSDMLSKALAIGTPLINSFPMMAGITAVTVALGLMRMVKQRDPDAADGNTRKQADPDADANDEDSPSRRRPRTGESPRSARDAASRNRRGTALSRETGASEDGPGDAADQHRTGQAADQAPPKVRREQSAPERERRPRESGQPQRGQLGPSPERADPRPHGDGRDTPGTGRPGRPGRDSGRDRRVPPPPHSEEPRQDDPARGDQPPRRRPASPRRGGPTGDQPRGGGGQSRPWSGPRDDKQPRGGRPWDSDRP